MGSASAVAVAVASAVFLWCSYTFTNDHFGRISPARQMLVFGETPFQDFLDPGFFLTLYSSAFAQWLFGHNLLGEVVLDVACMAVGYAFVFRLARQGSGSVVVGLAATAAALVVTPRAYDYDKVLFYPWGLYACWRSLDRPTLASLAHLAIVIVLGGLFRYDTAVFLGAAGVVGMVSRHWRQWRLLARRLLALAGLAAALASPVLLFLQFHGGITAAVDQVVTYARREGARTHVLQLTPLRLEAGTPMRELLADPVAAATVLSYVGLALPIAALLTARVAPRRAGTAASAKRLSVAVLVASTTLVIARDPVLARIGAVMPIIAVLAAVVLADSLRGWSPGQRPVSGLWTAYRAGVGVLAIGLTFALLVPATLLARTPHAAYLSRWRVAELAQTPPAIGLASRYEPLVAYVRACTAATDRVLATWFVPELYFFSGRAFAGGLPVMFGGHWSEDRFQRQILQLLGAQTVPLVIMRFGEQQRDVDYVREVWPHVSDYVTRHYEVAAVTDFGTGDLTYQIWARRGARPSSQYGPAAIPCYGAAGDAASR